MMKELISADYRALAELRYQVRRFLHFSEQTARKARLEPQQHQLLLSIKGLPSGRRSSIGELAERMQLRHHSTVELANRLAARGLVKRHRNSEDRREVLLEVTSKGEQVLRKLSLDHRVELSTQGPVLVKALNQAMRTGTTSKGKHD
jgi:DNA-binding MarR family transcriptional regulator